MHHRTTPSETASENTLNEPNPRVVVSLAYVSVAAVLFFVVLAIALGRSVTEKIATEMAMPLGLLCLLLFMCIVHAARSRNWKMLLVSGVGTLLLLLAGNRIVANRFVGSLESRFASVDPFQRSFDKAVLLGGAVRESPSGLPQLNENGDRLVIAARMYHKGLVKELYCSGTKSEGISKAILSESELSRRILIELGVAPDAIHIIEGRNTQEEMQSIHSTFGDEEVGIITSAWHLPRVMRLATKMNVNAIPIPSNYIGDNAVTDLPLATMIRDCVPGHKALSINSRALREYLAGIVGR